MSRERERRLSRNLRRYRAILGGLFGNEGVPLSCGVTEGTTSRFPLVIKSLSPVLAGTRSRRLTLPPSLGAVGTTMMSREFPRHDRVRVRATPSSCARCYCAHSRRRCGVRANICRASVAAQARSSCERYRRGVRRGQRTGCCTHVSCVG